MLTLIRTRRQRRELTHTQLTTEVISQLVGRFNPDVGMIKRRTEDLLGREYLERIEIGDAPAYRYLA